MKEVTKKKTMNKYKLMIIIAVSIFSLHSFGNNHQVWNISDFGAIPDGETLNTQAIQQAIDYASAHGGGRVLVPSGVFLTGSIQMKSHVELFLAGGSVLLGSTNPNDYFKIKGNSSFITAPRHDNSELGLILAVKADSISLNGTGMINGQGLALALNVDSLYHVGKLVDKYYSGRPSELVRPKLFNWIECKDISIRNVTLKNSAGWGMSFDLCRNMLLDSLKVINRAYWNNDGIDVIDCYDVRISNCEINSADDGICLKSYHPEFFNDSISIHNCTIRSSASAIKFGTASFGGFKNITIDSINVYDTFRSAVAIESVDGGDIENISISNIQAKNTGNALFIRLGQRNGENKGSVKHIRISNMKVQVPLDRPDINYDLRGPDVGFFHNSFPASIAGMPGRYIEDVVLNNIEISYPGRATKGMAYVPLWDLNRVPEKIKSYPEFSMFGELPCWGLYARHAKNLQLTNIHLTLNGKDYRPAFIFDDVNQLHLSHLILNGEGIHPQIILRNVRDKNIQSTESLKIIN